MYIWSKQCQSGHFPGFKAVPTKAAQRAFPTFCKVDLSAFIARMHLTHYYLEVSGYNKKAKWKYPLVSKIFFLDSWYLQISWYQLSKDFCFQCLLLTITVCSLNSVTAPTIHTGLRYKGWDVISEVHQLVVFPPTYFRRETGLVSYPRLKYLTPPLSVKIHLIFIIF